MRVTAPRPAALLCLALLSLLTSAQADSRVRFVGNATASYLARKFPDSQPRRETYVFAVGQRFEGATVDGTFDRTTFRQIAETLAPALAHENFWPTKELTDADLLLVVHWGVTIPQSSMFEMTGRTTTSFEDTPRSLAIDSESQALSDIAGAIGALDFNASDQRWDQYTQIADQNARDINDRSTAGLLGYNRTLAKYNESIRYAAEQYTLQTDLRTERYFVIVRAYDLKAKTKDDRSRPVWTMHLNVSSPGNNFTIAMNLMSEAAAPHFGHATGVVGTSRPKMREGKVDIGNMIILGEVQSTIGSGSHGGSR